MHWAEREWVYEVFDTMHLQPWQRINHFRNGRELCRKDNLIKNVKRFRRALEKEGRFVRARLARRPPLRQGRVRAVPKTRPSLTFAP